MPTGSELSRCSSDRLLCLRCGGKSRHRGHRDRTEYAINVRPIDGQRGTRRRGSVDVRHLLRRLGLERPQSDSCQLPVLLELGHTCIDGGEEPASARLTDLEPDHGLRGLVEKDRNGLGPADDRAQQCEPGVIRLCRRRWLCRRHVRCGNGRRRRRPARWREQRASDGFRKRAERNQPNGIAAKRLLRRGHDTARRGRRDLSGFGAHMNIAETDEHTDKRRYRAVSRPVPAIRRHRHATRHSLTPRLKAGNRTSILNVACLSEVGRAADRRSTCNPIRVSTSPDLRAPFPTP